MATTVELQPRVLRNVDLIFGDELTGNDFKHHTNVCQITPRQQVVAVTGLGGKTFRSVALPDWSLDLAVAGNEAGTSLAEYLRTQEGEMIPVLFRPASGTGPSFTVNVLVVAVPIGGTGGAEDRYPVSLPCDGPPMRAEAA